MDKPKDIVQRIISDREAMELLCRALARDTDFTRAMVEALNEAIADGARLNVGG